MSGTTALSHADIVCLMLEKVQVYLWLLWHRGSLPGLPQLCQPPSPPLLRTPECWPLPAHTCHACGLPSSPLAQRVCKPVAHAQHHHCLHNCIALFCLLTTAKPCSMTLDLKVQEKPRKRNPLLCCVSCTFKSKAHDNSRRPQGNPANKNSSTGAYQ